MSEDSAKVAGLDGIETGDYDDHVIVQWRAPGGTFWQPAHGAVYRGPARLAQAMEVAHRRAEMHGSDYRVVQVVTAIVYHGSQHKAGKEWNPS